MFLFALCDRCHICVKNVNTIIKNENLVPMSRHVAASVSALLPRLDPAPRVARSQQNFQPYYYISKKAETIPKRSDEKAKVSRTYLLFLNFYMGNEFHFPFV